MPQSQVLAFAIGDPAGISPELAARLLADPVAQTATLLVIGDRRVLDMGAAHAGVTLDLPTVTAEELGSERPQRSCFVDLKNCDPAAITLGASSPEGGASALANFRCALLAAKNGYADAVFFTPFNKHSMRLSESDYVDEIGFVNRTIEVTKNGSEFNVLDEVWNARCTSHIPLSKVAESITEDRVFESLRLTIETMQGAGYERPRIGVAALNPHAGDGGNFGTEDDAIILPAVQRAQAHQMAVTGPVPSDTVFVRAMKGEFDAVLTMFHDQGQIAMKLIGFDRGVTLIAGYPFPIVTPAHGTAFDIAGQGIANPGAGQKAIELGLMLAARKAAEGDVLPAPETPLSALFAKGLQGPRAA
ncbi:4-hydroxythreonine-4-phosphate dehydrogenase PdxA [Aurantimonas coralicida]|uniref:4-hydroxythreonine-4-phosphate dehydrogenase PdxA n=1 Tax=Aurantimonas coralicida TaxID=182270 RepID=UPI00238AC320|nr:4-hydroxythreonine-4-phosphate dehydrogenase PdxA [Aurantimonas coralicida]MDE0925250.1 4-hydroxythreonine-4-phosphate dehydrogenase PdxA [Aurantimonas coralicida]